MTEEPAHPTKTVYEMHEQFLDCLRLAVPELIIAIHLLMKDQDSVVRLSFEALV